jgi:hypothetical protein
VNLSDIGFILGLREPAMPVAGLPGPPYEDFIYDVLGDYFFEMACR